jgi:hypothetical protein
LKEFASFAAEYYCQHAYIGRSRAMVLIGRCDGP